MKNALRYLLATLILISVITAQSAQAARTDDVWQERFGAWIETQWATGRDILINGLNHYLNFGPDSGFSGYGFRDNSGTMEVKNSGGSWASIGISGGSGTPGGSVGEVQYNGSGSVFAGVATTTLTAGSNVTFTGTPGYLIGGTNLTINASGGSGSGTVSTSTIPTIGHIPFWTTSGATPELLGSVATSSLSVGTGLTNSGTLGAQVGGSAASISFAAIAANSLWANQTGASAVPTVIATSSLGIALSDTVGTLAVANGGTGQTSFGQGWLHSDGTTLTSSTSPTVNYLIATSTTATSTFANAIQIGTTAGDNALRITAGRVYPASNSVGGMLMLSNGTVNTGPALVAYTNVVTSTGNLANFRCDNASMAHDCVKIDYDGTGDGLAIAATAAASNALSLSNTGVDHTLNVSYTGATANKGAMNLTSTNTGGSVFQISGLPDGLGVGKITHSGVGDADSSILSLAASDTGYLGQGLFLDMETAGTQKIMNLRSDGIDRFVLDSTGLASTTDLILSANPSALLLTGSVGDVNTYAGTSCTNQFPRSLSALGAATCASVSLSADVTSTLTVANGGTGATTLTGLLQGNGTSAITGITGTVGQFPYYNGTNTLTATSSLALSVGGLISTTAVQPATSTTMVLDWVGTPNQVEYRIGASATTITLINATTSAMWGSRKLVWVCNPGESAGALTWVGVEWIGATIPTQTTTANACDVYSFDITRATSTSAYKAAGSQGANFQ